VVFAPIHAQTGALPLISKQSKNWAISTHAKLSENTCDAASAFTPGEKITLYLSFLTNSTDWAQNIVILIKAELRKECRGKHGPPHEQGEFTANVYKLLITGMRCSARCEI